MKLFVTDLDGTLLNNQKEISPANKEALRKLSQSGCKIVFATGRAIPSAAKYMAEIGLEEGYLLPFNGGLIIEFKKQALLFEKYHDKKDVMNMMDISDHLKIPMILSEREESCIYIPEDGEKNMDEVCRFYTAVNQKEAIHFIEKYNTLRTVFRLTDPERLQRLYSYLEDQALSPVISDTDCIELLPDGWGKGAAVKWLGNHLGIGAEEICAIGDQENDAGMLQFAGIGIAMGNAGEDIQVQADWVTKTNIEDGVAHAIQCFIDDK